MALHAPSPSPSTKDSVELLLEGMAGPRPDRRKTKPQSDGEASAAYHAEHGVRRARTPSQPDAKVLIERTPTPPAPPLVDTVAPRPRFQPEPEAESREALSTFVPARVLRRRVALAVVAGLLIVMISFVGLRLSASRRSQAPSGPASAATLAAKPPTTVQPLAQVVASPAPVAPSPAAPSVEAMGSVSSEGPAASARPSAPALSGTASHRRGHYPADPGADLGEFKSKF